jgi:Ca-activated chloride channel family protein
MAGDLMNFVGIYWEQGSYIVWSPIVLIIIGLLIRHHNVIIQGVKNLVALKNMRLFFPSFSFIKRRIKTACMIGAVIALFLALLRPQWNKQEQTIEQHGRDVFILLDISRSMLAEDIKPNRLECAKLKIRTLLSLLEIERVGLILFSGSAFLQCPLTADHNAFLMFLNQVTVETIASGTTSVQAALVQAMNAFQAAQGKKNKLVLLITDGEDFSSSLESMKHKAHEAGITLFALGVGSEEGAPIPIVDARGNKLGYEKENNGTIALSKLNSPLLESLCKSLGGHSFKVTYTDTDVESIAAKIKQYETEAFFDKKLSLYQDQYRWFVGIAWILLALEWIL